MPYADRQKQREAQRESYRRRLADPEFAQAERQRKAGSQATEAGHAALRARVARWRAKQAEMFSEPAVMAMVVEKGPPLYSHPNVVVLRFRKAGVSDCQSSVCRHAWWQKVRPISHHKAVACFANTLVLVHIPG